MWIFLIIFFAASIGFTVLNISVAESKKIFYLSIALPIVVSMFFYPYAVEVSNQTLTLLLEQEGLVSLIALVQIFESIFLIVLSTLQINGHYNFKAKKIIPWLTLLPSFVFLIGLFFLQSYCYLSIDGLPYWLIAVLFSIGIGVGLVVSLFLTKVILPQWDLRAEFKMLTCLFQILLAMFLPLIVKGVQVPFSNLTVESKPILITVATVLSISIVGLAINWWKSKKYYSKQTQL